MAKKTKQEKDSRSIDVGDWYVYAILFVVSVLVRVPFLGRFDLVTYDGTYYINQARGFLGAPHLSGAFPIGYPVFIAALLPVFGDGVRAAQIISFAAGIGTLFVFFVLGKRLVSRSLAMVAAFVLALTPVFIRLSLMTLSESFFIFWLFLGLLFFVDGRDRFFGLTMGMAAITRPEALGIFLVLAFLRRHPAKRLIIILSTFAVVYLVNTAVLSNTLGRFVLVPKSEFFGTSAASWKGREAWVDFAGKESVEAELETENGHRNVFRDYALRLPREIAMLGRHVMPVVFLLALYGVFRKRVFLLALFLPLIVYPFFTVRSEPRYILPYVPPLIMYAAIGIHAISNKSARRTLIGLLVLSTAVGLYVNREQLTTPVSQGFQWAKKLGLEFKDRLEQGDKVADRKPFFAFYAEAQYVEIPVGPYDDTLRSLAGAKVRYLVLHRSTIHTLRPGLQPLLYDRDVIAGELRFRQVYFDPGVVLVYERTGPVEPLKSGVFGPPSAGTVVFPAWSPDGKIIAYRVTDSSGGGGIFVIPAGGGDAQRAISERGTTDPLAWAPDSKRIAFASASKGNMDLYVFDVFSGELEQLTSDGGADTSPSWSRNGSEIVFCSDRGGGSDIWAKDLRTGELTQISTGGDNTYPALSPDGQRIAWTREARGVVVLDRPTGRQVILDSPRDVLFAPAWSPDGRVLAVTAKDWGGADVYLTAADGSGALLLTKSVAGDGMPSWAPDGDRVVIVSNQDGEYHLRKLTGVEAFAERVLNPVGIRVFPRPSE